MSASCLYTVPYWMCTVLLLVFVHLSVEFTVNVHSLYRCCQDLLLQYLVYLGFTIKLSDKTHVKPVCVGW